uniref:Uncharacterized protein n=1 Tax=Timema douglasi TaxID=61478 RepID=A0A7R8ZEJ7_TIMDO|nr:unnamed protein product [Timema douglasi]
MAYITFSSKSDYETGPFQSGLVDHLYGQVARAPADKSRGSGFDPLPLPDLYVKHWVWNGVKLSLDGARDLRTTRVAASEGVGTRQRTERRDALEQWSVLVEKELYCLRGQSTGCKASVSDSLELYCLLGQSTGCTASVPDSL